MKKISFLTVIIFCFQWTNAQFQTNGSAVAIVTDTCYRITQAINSQNGSVWNVNQVNLNEDFEILANLYFGTNDAGADGMVFAFQQVSVSAGTSGGGMGIQGVQPSLFVPFDTYQNGVNTDPVFDHVSINRNGDINHTSVNNLAGPVQASASNTNIEDGNNHLVLIRWLVDSISNTQTLEVYFDCVLRVTATDNFINTIFSNNPNVFWGFTAATGGLNNEHSFCFEYVSALATNLGDQSTCIGDSAQIAAPPIGNAYSWTPTNGLSNPNIENPLASPSITTTYTVSISNICGNTIEDSLTVFVLDTNQTNLKDTICEGESIFAEGAFQTTPGTYVDTFQNLSGCDSIVAIELTVLDTSQTLFSVDICENSSYNFNGQTLNTSGTYIDTLLNQNGCDSIVTLNLGILPLDTTIVDTSICMGDSFNWNGQNIQGAGSYTTVLTNMQACDSTLILNVSMLPSDTVYQDTVICAGDVFIWNGQNINSAGLYNTSFNNSLGCDSTIFLTVFVDDVNFETENISICLEDSIFLANEWQNTPGAYLDTFRYQMSQCDSVIRTTNLSLLPLTISIIDTFICTGDSLFFDDYFVYAAGTYIDTVDLPGFCDEVLELRVSVGELPNVEIEGPSFFCVEDGSELVGFSSSPTINWLPVNSSANPLSISSSNLYILESIDSLGCIGRDSLSVNAIEDCYELILPTAFSPNQDGVNDLFKPLNSPEEYYSLEIYNRFGELMFRSNDPGFGWDGIFKGKAVEIGVYSFSADYQFKPEHEIKNVNGSFTIIR